MMTAKFWAVGNQSLTNAWPAPISADGFKLSQMKILSGGRSARRAARRQSFVLGIGVAPSVLTRSPINSGSAFAS
jgi:hypothetical protein